MVKDPEEQYMPKDESRNSYKIKPIIQKKVSKHDVILARFKYSRPPQQPFVVCLDSMEDPAWALCFDDEESAYATFIAVDKELVDQIVLWKKKDYELQSASGILQNMLVNKVLFAKERRLKEK